jgi:hypothetical protein
MIKKGTAVSSGDAGLFLFYEQHVVVAVEEKRSVAARRLG